MLKLHQGIMLYLLVVLTVPGCENQSKLHLTRQDLTTYLPSDSDTHSLCVASIWIEGEVTYQLRDNEFGDLPGIEFVEPRYPLFLMWSSGKIEWLKESSANGLLQGNARVPPSRVSGLIESLIESQFFDGYTENYSVNAFQGDSRLVIYAAKDNHVEYSELYVDVDTVYQLTRLLLDSDEEKNKPVLDAKRIIHIVQNASNNSCWIETCQIFIKAIEEPALSHGE